MIKYEDILKYSKYKNYITNIDIYSYISNRYKKNSNNVSIYLDHILQYGNSSLIEYMIDNNFITSYSKSSNRSIINYILNRDTQLDIFKKLVDDGLEKDLNIDDIIDFMLYDNNIVDIDKKNRYLDILIDKSNNRQYIYNIMLSLNLDRKTFEVIFNYLKKDFHNLDDKLKNQIIDYIDIMNKYSKLSYDVIIDIFEYNIATPKDIHINLVNMPAKDVNYVDKHAKNIFDYIDRLLDAGVIYNKDDRDMIDFYYKLHIFQYFKQYKNWSKESKTNFLNAIENIVDDKKFTEKLDEMNFMFSLHNYIDLYALIRLEKYIPNHISHHIVVLYNSNIEVLNNYKDRTLEILKNSKRFPYILSDSVFQFCNNNYKVLDNHELYNKYVEYIIYKGDLELYNRSIFKNYDEVRDFDKLLEWCKLKDNYPIFLNIDNIMNIKKLKRDEKNMYLVKSYIYTMKHINNQEDDYKKFIYMKEMKKYKEKLINKNIDIDSYINQLKSCKLNIGDI